MYRYLNRLDFINEVPEEECRVHDDICTSFGAIVVKDYFNTFVRRDIEKVYKTK